MIYRLSLAWPQLQKSAKARCSTSAFLKLFTFREVESMFVLLQCHIPSPELLFTSLFTLDIKESLKEDMRFFDGGF
jgi:hypothetical protein